MADSYLVRVEPGFSFQQLYVRGKSQPPSISHSRLYLFQAVPNLWFTCAAFHGRFIFLLLNWALSCLAPSRHFPLLVTVLLYGGLWAAMVFSLKACFALLNDLKVELRTRYNLWVLIHEILWASPLRNKYVWRAMVPYLSSLLFLGLFMPYPFMVSHWMFPAMLWACSHGFKFFSWERRKTTCSVAWN